MCAIIDSASVKLLIIYFAINSAVSYENVYDLIERKNQKRFYEPRLRHYQTSEAFNYEDRDRHFTYNRNPYFSKFGNGYDNLGNGIPGHFSAHFSPFRHRVVTDFRSGWELERLPFYRTHSDRYRLGENPYMRSFHRYEDYPGHYSRGYYPSFESNPPITVHGNAFGNRGHSDVSQYDRYIQDNEDKNHKKTDEVFQRSHEGVNMDSTNREKVGEQSHANQARENKSTLKTNKIVKKGHTTKGFASHHHKDETGNSTTFFDESSDFGDQSDFKDFADGFGTTKALESVSTTGDEKFYTENGGQTANYGSGFLKGNQKYEKDYASKGQQTTHGEKYHKVENQDPGPRKSYRYLNGDTFDYTDTHSDNYY